MINTLGNIFKVTTFGESHGPCVGCVIDGVPARLELSKHDFITDMIRRRPGNTRYTSQRRETDEVNILSGIYDNKTLGTPIALTINNNDGKSKDYSALEHVYRPGHGDYTYQQKYGIRDHRGGGRASARTLAPVVAAGCVAKMILKDSGINFNAVVTQIGEIKASQFDFNANNDFNFADESQVSSLKQYIHDIRAKKNSVGGAVKLCISNVQSGLGEPVFGRLDAMLSHSLHSINAVKGVIFGAGIDGVASFGSEFNDSMDKVHGFLSNNCGGVLAGISTGNNIVIDVLFKPTPSIAALQHTIDRDNKNREITIHGRHDPCVAIRAPVIVEAMAALVIVDLYLMQRIQYGT